MSQPGMVLGNFPEMKEEVPKVLRFAAYRIAPETIPDRITKQAKILNVLTLDVVEEDGKPVSKQYRVTSEKHARDLWPFLQDGSFKTRAFRITPHGKGFLREYTLEAL